MKMNLMLKLILAQRKANTEEGFTLIEALVVIIIIGILAALLIPGALNVASRARQSQAKIYVGDITNRQAQYRLENSTYATTAQQLKLLIPADDSNYTYTITATATRADFDAIAKDSDTLQSFRGTAAIVNGLSTSVTCQTVEPSATPPAVTITTAGAQCGAGAEPMR